MMSANGYNNYLMDVCHSYLDQLAYVRYTVLLVFQFALLSVYSNIITRFYQNKGEKTPWKTKVVDAQQNGDY